MSDVSFSFPMGICTNKFQPLKQEKSLLNFLVCPLFTGDVEWLSGLTFCGSNCAASHLSRYYGGGRGEQGRVSKILCGRPYYQLGWFSLQVTKSLTVFQPIKWLNYSYNKRRESQESVYFARPLSQLLWLAYSLITVTWSSAVPPWIISLCSKMEGAREQTQRHVLRSARKLPQSPQQTPLISHWSELSYFPIFSSNELTETNQELFPRVMHIEN